MYLNYQTFLKNLNESQKKLLSSYNLLFSYIVVDANKYELLEQPISQQILFSLFEDNGSNCKDEILKIRNGEIINCNNFSAKFDYIFIHPMISILPFLNNIIIFYKEKYPNSKIIILNSDQHQHEKLIGGPESENISNNILDHYNNIDYLISGFAEHSSISLLINNPSKGVFSKRHVLSNNKNSVHFFDYDSIGELHLKNLKINNHNNSIRIQRSRGCLSSCTYCIEGQANKTHLNEKSWDALNIDKFINKLEKLQKLNYFFINIIDSSFEDPGKKGINNVLYFAKKIIEKKIKLSFKIHFRSENYIKFTLEEFKLIKRAGIDIIICGIESGNQFELTFFNKIASKQQHLENFKYAENTKLFFNIIGYIMFTPTADENILKEKVEFLRELNRGWDFINLTSQLYVFWGTKIHKQLNNLKLTDNNQKINFGYVKYKFVSENVEKLNNEFNSYKISFPKTMSINKLLYDSLGLLSRAKNPANFNIYNDNLNHINEFEINVSKQIKKLNKLYCDNFLNKINNINYDFFNNIDLVKEEKYALDNIKKIFTIIKKKKQDFSKIHLDSWISVRENLGINKYS